MDSKSAPAASSDESFIQRQGGHLQAGGGTLKHTQDFLYPGSISVVIEQGQADRIRSFRWSFESSLGAAINAASIWQTYKLNSLTLDFYPRDQVVQGGGEEPLQIPFALAAVPYNRDPLQGAPTIQNPDPTQAINPFFLPGCQIKYFTGTSSIVSEGNNQFGQGPDQPQMLKVTTDNPKYLVPSEGVQGTTPPVSGGVYSDGALSLRTRIGPDNTEWFCFLYKLQMFAPASSNRQFIINIIGKANITFEGLRWDPSNLYSVNFERAAHTLGLDGLAGQTGIGRSQESPDGDDQDQVRLGKRTRSGRDDQQATLPRLRAVRACLEEISLPADIKTVLLAAASEDEGGSSEPPREHLSLQKVHYEQRRARARDWDSSPVASGGEEADGHPEDASHLGRNRGRYSKRRTGAQVSTLAISD